MQRRAMFSLINLGVAAGALIVFFLFPRYAGYAIYAFLGWFVVGLSTVWIARSNAPVPTPSPAGVVAGQGTPLPSGSARPPAGSSPSSAPAVGFCIYCANDLPPGADRCLACGHARAQFA